MLINGHARREKCSIFCITICVFAPVAYTVPLHSSENAIGDALVVVVLDGSPVVDALVNQAHDSLNACLLRQASAESLVHGIQTSLDPETHEAPELWVAVTHNFHELTNLIPMFPRLEEGSNDERSESFEMGAILSTHHVEVFLGEFERTCFESERAAWCIGEHKAKINVNQVTVAVEEKVTVVPVSDLKQVRHHRVSGTGLYKVELSLLEMVSKNE